MKVLFDATWVARAFRTNVMHGGLRVTFELAKRLVTSELCQAYLTSTVIENEYNEHLREFLQEVCNIDEDRVILNYPLILKVEDQIRKLSGLSRGREFIKRKLNINFVNDKLLDEFNVYHSPVEAIPDIIKTNSKIRPFFTSLDLIPFIRPEIAPKGFYELLKPAYDSIDEKTVVLAISESTRNDLLNYREDIKPENVVVTYIAADTDVFFLNKNEADLQRVKEKYNIEYESYFLVLNRIQKYKNTEHALKCFDMVTRSGELKDVGLIVIGQSYKDKDSQAILEEYRGRANIQFIEYVPDSDLSPLYSNALCFLYLSLYEGFGLPILEAMQCGVPVICSNTSSMPEVIGDCGLKINPSNEDELCNAMISIINDENLRTQFSKAGLKRAKLFSWDNYTKDVINAYKKFQYSS